MLLVKPPHFLRHIAAKFQPCNILTLNVIAPQHAGDTSHLGCFRKGWELEHNRIPKVVRLRQCPGNQLLAFAELVASGEKAQGFRTGTTNRTVAGHITGERRAEEFSGRIGAPFFTFHLHKPFARACPASDFFTAIMIMDQRVGEY